MRLQHSFSNHNTMEDSKLNLFVAEDEDMQDSGALENDPPMDGLDSAAALNDINTADEEDDPIIHTIPIFHGSVSERQSQTLHTFQFPGRPHTRTFAGANLEALMKPTSKVVELKTPMDTLKFYDESRTQELGTRVDKVSLQGVLDSTNENLYVATIVDHEGQDRVVLFPVDHTAQLRPLFKYIDDVEAARTAQLKSENVGAQKPSAVQVLQTASKSSQGGNNGPLAHGEGLCLKHVKQFNEELWEALSWHSNDAESTRGFSSVMKTPLEERVEVKSLFTSLIDDLMRSSASELSLED